MLLRALLFGALLAASTAQAATEVMLPEPAASSASSPRPLPLPKTPANLVSMAAMDRLLVCKASYAVVAKQHLAASVARNLADSHRAEALQAASDASLAIAVLDEAVGDDMAPPEARHEAAAVDKKERLAIVDYCGQTITTYIGMRMRTAPTYLTDLKPAAKQVLDDLRSPEADSPTR